MATHPAACSVSSVSRRRRVAERAAPESCLAAYGRLAELIWAPEAIPAA